VGEWVEYKVTSKGGTGGIGSLAMTHRNTVVKKTGEDVVVETWFLGWKPKAAAETTFKLTEPFRPLAPVGMMSVTIPSKTAFKKLDSGTESLTLAGKTFDTQWTRYEISGKALLSGVEKDLDGPRQLKVWYSPQVPVGGLVKAVYHFPDADSGAPCTLTTEYHATGKGPPAPTDATNEPKKDKPKLADFAGEWKSTESRGLFDSLSLGIEPNGKGSYAYSVSNNITAGVFTIKEGKDGFVLQVTSATKMEGDWELALTDGGNKLRLSRGKEKQITLAKKKQEKGR
jgi:hypothetical protein